MHIAPLADEGATWMNRYGGQWGAKVGLPTNPGARSRANFDEFAERASTHSITATALPRT